MAAGCSDCRLPPYDHRPHGKGGHLPAAHTHREWVGRLRAAVYDRLGREYLETQARGGIKRPTGQWISIPTQHITRTAKGKVGKAKRPRNIVNKPNVFFRHQGPTPDIVRRPRGKGKQLEVLYQLVPLARIPKRLRFYEDAAKVVQRRMVPNFKKSFERAVRTARR